MSLKRRTCFAICELFSRQIINFAVIYKVKLKSIGVFMSRLDFKNELGYPNVEHLNCGDSEINYANNAGFHRTVFYQIRN